MHERFTDRARKVLQLANEEAQRFNHEYIGTEHILLGLIKEGSGVAANVLKNLDIDLGKVRGEVEKLIQSGPDMVTMGKPPRTPAAKRVIEYAMEEARGLGHNYVGTEHLLLGLIREEGGVAAQILMNLGLTLQQARDDVYNLLGHGMPGGSAPVLPPLPAQIAEAAEKPPPACPKCGGSRVVRILWNRTALSRRHQDDIAAERAILARGSRNAPSWACLTCEPRWLEVHRLALQDYHWQLAKEEAIASEAFEEAIRLRDSQRELRPRLAALVDELLTSG